MFLILYSPMSFTSLRLMFSIKFAIMYLCSYNQSGQKSIEENIPGSTPFPRSRAIEVNLFTGPLMVLLFTWWKLLLTLLFIWLLLLLVRLLMLKLVLLLVVTKFGLLAKILADFSSFANNLAYKLDVVLVVSLLDMLCCCCCLVWQCLYAASKLDWSLNSK